MLTGEAHVILSWGGTPPDLDDLLSKPGVSVLMRVEVGEVELVLKDPQLQAYCDADVPVILDFARSEDAYEFKRRLSANQRGQLN